MKYSLQQLLQRLPELDARLRAADFSVSPDRWQSLYDLIYRLESDDKIPDDIEQLAHLISPLFCNNAVEQQSFYALFRHWAQGDVETRISEEIVQTSAIATTQQKSYQKKSRQLPVIAILLVLLLLSGSLTYFMTRPPEVLQDPTQDAPRTLQTIASQEREITPAPPEPVIEQKKNLQPISPRQPPEAVTLDASSQSDMRFTYYLLLSLPLIFFIAWLLRRWWRKRVVLNFHKNLRGDPLMYLKLKHHKTLPFGWGEFSRRLKRGGSVQTRKLDIVKTIDKTIHKAGLFTPVMHTHDPNPAYLVLVNRSNARDHTADRADRLVERLQEANVTVYRFEYHDDPQLCFSVGQNRKSHTLSQLARHYAGCRLILIGDGEALLDPFSGSLQRWVRQFDSWEPRVLLTPAAQPWDARESQIAHSGFAVAPFQVHGLEAVSDWLLKPSIDASVWFTREGSDPYPGLFELDEDEWLSSTPPQDYDAEITCSTLYQYLGQSGYRLLAACAVYPRLVSMLTITLDQILFPADTGTQREQRLVQLSRLPWFRHGKIPDYLRADILQRIAEPVVEHINEAYLQIFARISELPGREASSLQAGGFKYVLRELVLFAPADSPMADSLFADVMLSEKRPAPNWVIRQKLANLLPRKRYRLWPVDLVAGACVMVAAALHFAWSWADPLIEQEMMAQMQAGYADISVQISTHEDTQALGDALEGSLKNWGFTQIQRQYAKPLSSDTTLGVEQRINILNAELSRAHLSDLLGLSARALKPGLDRQFNSLKFKNEDFNSDAVIQNITSELSSSLQAGLLEVLSNPEVELNNRRQLDTLVQQSVTQWVNQIDSLVRRMTAASKIASNKAEQIVKSDKLSDILNKSIKRTIPASRDVESLVTQVIQTVRNQLPAQVVNNLADDIDSIVRTYQSELDTKLALAESIQRNIPDAIIYADGHLNAAQTVQQRLAYLTYGGTAYPLLKDEGIVLKQADSPLHLSVNLSQPLSAGGVFRDKITLKDTKATLEPEVSQEDISRPECNLANFADVSYWVALERLNSSGCFSIDRNSSQLAQSVRELLNDGDNQSYQRALTRIQQDLETKQGGNALALKDAIVRLQQDISDQPSPPAGLKRAWNLGNRLDRLPEAVGGIDLEENLLQEKCSRVSNGDCNSEFASASDLVRAIHLVNAVIDSYAVQSQQPQVILPSGTLISLKSNNGQYLTRCRNCMSGVRDSITVHLDDKNFAAYGQFTIQAGPEGIYMGLRTDLGQFLAACPNCKKADNSGIIVTAEGVSPEESAQSRISMTRLDNGKVALGLAGQEGLYLVRCEGCIPGAANKDNAVFISADPQTEPLAQWDLNIIQKPEIAQLESNSDSNLDQVEWTISTGGNGHVYQYVRSRMRWTEAKLAAEKLSVNGMRGHLAAITSKAENDFIVKLKKQGDLRAWIGLRYDRKQKQFNWVTGEKVDYVNWNKGEPNHLRGEDFVEMFASARWNDNTDGYRFNQGFIVEFEPTGSPRQQQQQQQPQQQTQPNPQQQQQQQVAPATLIEPEMVVIPAGTFVMGSPESEQGRRSDEGPQHEVSIRSFALGRTEVTFDEYDRFAEATGRKRPNDEGWGRGSRPVINVSWDDATAYAEWLSEQTGKGYRLPSEAEWEYAARAGTTTRYSWGDDIDCGKARYGFNSGECGQQRSTDTVGGFPANAFGLLDMHGNVWEWTQDCWHGNYEGAPGDGSAWLEADNGECARRVVRGGGWNSRPQGLRSAIRLRYDSEAFNNRGFRLARAL